MRGVPNRGGGGDMVGMILKIAPIVCSFFAFLFLAIALSSGSMPHTMEGVSIINVRSIITTPLLSQREY